MLIHCGIEQSFKMTPKQLEKSQLLVNTKIVVINSPSNPTGSVYSAKERIERAVTDILLNYPDIICSN